MEHQRKKQKIEEAVIAEKFLLDMSDDEQDTLKEFDAQDQEICDAQEKSEAEDAVSDDFRNIPEQSTEFESGKTTPQNIKNYMPIENTVSAGVRYGLSATQTAAVATGFLKDLINAGILGPEYSYLAVDKSKVMRAKSTIISGASEDGDRECMEGDIRGIFFDGRKDFTKHMVKDVITGSLHPRVIKENHVSVTSEPDGKYRYHFTPDNPTPLYKHAKEEAKRLYDWLVKVGLDKSLEVIIGDSTNSNTG